MSRENAEIVRALVDRWNAGERDVTNLHDHLDPAIELESPLASVAGEAYQGYAGIERWVLDLDEQFAYWNIGLDDVRQIGSQVISIGMVNARGRTSEVPLQFPTRQSSVSGATIE